VTAEARLAAILFELLAGAAEPAGRRDRVEAATCACPCADAAPSAHPFRRPSQAAFDLNRKGREHYRARRWEEARASYQQALLADPAFLAPRLNIACAHVQQERFAEVVAEASELARAGFMPWSRQIREAADLAPLHARPEEMKALQEALQAAGRSWGAALQGAVLFVARRAPPVRLPPRGVLYLGLEQEILAWLPGSGVYRQVTAEEGRVLGFVQSADGRTVVYVRAGRLVREPGRKASLRALSLRRLDLPTMALGPEVPVSGDVLALQVDPPGPDGTTRVVLETGDKPRRPYRLDGVVLVPLAGPAPSNGGSRTLRLTAEGVGGSDSETRSSPCRFHVRDVRSAGGPPAVRIQPVAGKAFPLEAAFGAGLRGLPFP
jgi:hypothetical protein